MLVVDGSMPVSLVCVYFESTSKHREGTATPPCIIVPYQNNKKSINHSILVNKFGLRPHQATNIYIYIYIYIIYYIFSKQIGKMLHRESLSFLIRMKERIRD
jgi:hypothetical protein